MIFAPYETYLDDVLGVKTSYGAAVLIRNEPESAKLALYQKYIPDIQDALPIAAADQPSKRGQPTPMEVMDAPFRAGDLLHGYQAVADNLPNDPRIHDTKGTKKIFFKNFMDARVNYVVLPLAKYLMPEAQAAQASGEGYLAAVVLHEISHGLGPAYSRVNGKQVAITEAIGPLYSPLEEAKADVVGMYGLAWLMDHGALPKNRAQEYYSSYVAGIFRSVRYGVAEAHGRAEMMEFNYLVEQKAVNRVAGKYAVDFARMPAAIASLSKELLTIEATGDRRRAEAWFNRYDKMPDEAGGGDEGGGETAGGYLADFFVPGLGLSSMKRFTLPKLAVILATLVSFAWIVILYALPGSPVSGPRAAMALAIPVALSLWGLSSDRFRRLAGAAILVYSLLAIFFVSFLIMGLSYLPSAILLLISKRAEARAPAPSLLRNP